MNKAQEIDYAYHADRLLLLIARRGKLPADSDQIPALDMEIMSIEDLVRAYRLAFSGKPHSTTGIRVFP
jgi:hypothetical protein